MRTSEQINEIASAMAAAQAEIGPAVKDAVNPAYRSKYADLSAIWSAIRAPLSKHRIAVWQEAATDGEGVAVTTRLAHASGQWVEFGPFSVPLSKRDAHGVGSATSYAKRYAIAAAVGVVAEDDDDGNTASIQKPAAAVPAPPRVVTTAAATVDRETGEELPDLPQGVYYLTGYHVSGEWHEAHLLKWDAQGGPLKVATKRKALGDLMLKASNERLPVTDVDVTVKKNTKGEAWLNRLSAYHPEIARPVMDVDHSEPLDASSIPF